MPTAARVPGILPMPDLGAVALGCDDAMRAWKRTWSLSLLPPGLSFTIALGLALGCAPVVDEPSPLLAESERGVAAGDELTPPGSLSHALPDGSVVRVVRGADPGESDLFIGARSLAPARGADELPLVLAGGAGVVFVSSRTGVASLWQVGLDGAGLVQLTNHGQRPGHLDDGFVPPPARTMRQDGEAVVYDDGSGRLWRIALSEPAARPAVRP